MPRTRETKGRRKDRRSVAVSDGATLSRSNSTGHYAAARKARGRSKGIRIALVCILAVILVGGGAALAYVANINARLSSGVDQNLRDQLVASDLNEPFYMLLLGVDKSQDRENSSEYGTSDSAYRSDTIILARIDTQNKQVTLVSIHRDTQVSMGDYGDQKINAAYSIGGASYVTQVVSEFAGVPISHYAEIDFEQFVSIVDTLGGVEVNVPVDCYDPDYSGADIKAGTQTLNGTQALQLCRARHAYDDYGDGDAYRAANQRAVITAIIKKVLSSDIATMTSTINTLADSVTTDLSATDILALAQEMKGMDTSNIYSAMNPTTSEYSNNIWWEISNTSDWQTMMSRVDQGLSPYADSSEDTTSGVAASSNTNSTSSSTSVLVLNGTSTGGLAGEVADKISSADSSYSTSSDNAQGSYTSTIVVYNGSDYKDAAAAIASTLGSNVTVLENDGSYSTDANVVVYVGTDME